MCLETIGSLVLFPRSDVSEGRRLTFEHNEHIYGMWRMILREFNMEQLIIIVQNNNLRMSCIIESDLAVSRPIFFSKDIKVRYLFSMRA